MNWINLTAPPVLPGLMLMHLWMVLGWGLLMAYAMAWLLRSFGVQARRIGALAMLLWAAVPGTFSPAYWLDLGFQGPCTLLVLVVALRLVHLVGRTAGAGSGPGDAVQARGSVWLLLAGVALGWLLALDTFALLPLEMYAWGFGVPALLTVLAASLVPWLWARRGTRMDIADGMPLLAVLLYAATHLPAGNVWDAVMGPGFWLVLHLLLLQRLNQAMCQFRKNRRF